MFTLIRYGAFEFPNVKRPPNVCSIIVYPMEVGVTALLETGIYFTPAAHNAESKARMLTGEASENERMDARLRI